jgi:N-acetylmuramoyl-L-alanine amidase
MIIENHLLVGAKLQLLAGGKPMLIRRLVVVHFTSGATAQSSINFWKEPKSRSIDLGAHVIIDRDGTITQCRPFNKTISHAGQSKWVDPKTGKKYTGCNQFSIGIELANAGNDDRVIRIASQLNGYAGIVTAKHRNGGPMDEWEDYSKAQYNSCLEVTDAVVKRYNLDDISGHDCIAPNRKNDPGPAFPMAKLRASCGFSGLPAVHY